MTDETRRLKRIRSRLMRAVRSERPAHLRQACVELASDIDAMIEGRPVADEACAETLRGGAPPSERDTVPAPPPAASSPPAAQ